MLYISSKDIGTTTDLKPAAKIIPFPDGSFGFSIVYLDRRGPRPDTICDEKYYGTLRISKKDF